MNLPYSRGEVIWGPEPFKSVVKPRPWVVLSNEKHPFHGEGNRKIPVLRHRNVWVYPIVAEREKSIS